MQKRDVEHRLWKKLHLPVVAGALPVSLKRKKKGGKKKKIIDFHTLA
jgi:hypothetical protein